MPKTTELTLDRFIEDVESVANRELDKKTKKKIKNGSYCVLDHDKGELYRLLKKADYGAYKSTGSDHESSAKQYRIDIENDGCILFGKRKDKSTFFQVELTSPRKNICSHFMDCLRYKITNRNVGPKGTSKNTENYPLFIDVWVKA